MDIKLRHACSLMVATGGPLATGGPCVLQTLIMFKHKCHLLSHMRQILHEIHARVIDGTTLHL